MSMFAAGMEESDLSDDADDMVFSYKKSTESNNSKITDSEPAKQYKENGVHNRASNSISHNDTKQVNTEKNNYFHRGRGRGNVQRGRNRKVYDRNQNHRRRTVEFKSDQVFDDLRYAIQKGDLDTVKSIIAKGVWVDSILQSGWTALMYACSFSHFEIVAYLLEANADPNYHSDMFTPLMAVCASKRNEEDSVKCVTLLLKYGAKVNVKERHFTTPLTFAVREGYSLIVKILLEHDAEVNTQDNRGKTALAWAASCGHGQIVRLLMDKNADASLQDCMGQCPIDLAYENNFPEVSSLLQKLSSNKTEISEDSIELVPKKVDKFVTATLRSGASRTFEKVGDLELFLSGIGISELLPVFNEHQLTFADILVMDEQELEKIGISQVGVRKKILEACKTIHKKDWENNSLPNLKQYQYISCLDAVSMMANVSKHLRYISSSVLYIRQQIQVQPRILELSQDSANVHNLLDETEDSLKNISQLNDEIRFLKMHLDKVQNNVEYERADLIAEVIPATSKQRKLIVGTVSIATITAIAVCWWKSDAISFIPMAVRVRLS